MDPGNMRLVGRTPDIAEAERIAEEWRLQGFEARIIRRSEAGMSLFEVWIGREPEIKS
jgi:hypothetical protein